jgi:ribose-phosphate pyrophosphokinase
MRNIKIFGLGDSIDYAKKVCEHIGVRLSEHEETYFDDGECYVRSKENVRGADVFVICSLYNSVTERLADKVMKLLFFTGSLRDASAARVTLVFPYLSYQRQDRKNKSRAPIYTKYLPMILESVGPDRILVLDPHNLSAFQSGNRMVNDHIEAKYPIADAMVKAIQIDRIAPEDIVVASPDEGGVKRARFFRDVLAKTLNTKINIAYVDKTHENDGNIEANAIIGDVKDKYVIVFDDMMSSLKTMHEANEAVTKAGGKVYAVCASHGLCVGEAQKYATELLNAGIKIVITDSVKPYRLDAATINRLQIIETSSLIAEAIRRIHNEESVSGLIK